MKKHTNYASLLAAACLWAGISPAVAQVTLEIDAGMRGPEIGKRHYGIFFEEINHAGDGGLYAELIRNRSFEDNAGAAEHWITVGGATLSLVTDGLLNDVQQRAAEVRFAQSGDGIANPGFWGINIVEGQTYKLTFWAKNAAGYSGTLTAMLQTADGSRVLGRTVVDVPTDTDWQKVTAEITAMGTDGTGRFVLAASKAGTLTLDMISLFPPTYKNRENGCRIDLAEKLEAMHPSFVRFPGGCYIEGSFDNGVTNRFEWKKTVGPVERRPGHLNRNWNYPVTDGMGFHEFLQLTEDLGAEPLFVVNIGLGHGWQEDYQQIDEYIQEALDAVEYANGDITTPYGKMRAENGHPEPFNLRLLEIGNENYNFYADNNWDQSDHYAERYYAFYQALKAKHPEITLIGNVESWGTDNPSWRNAYPVEVVDEHYYRSPSWFVSQYEKYNTYSRAHYKVYAGEYAVTQDYGVCGNLNAALGEAVYMLGMENNSDVCVMNSYAPIFVNENDQAWRPDMIRFNSYTSFGTPSYYIQQLFPTHVGKENVKFTEQNNLKTNAGLFGIGTWQTRASFDNIKAVYGADNQVVCDEDFSGELQNWTATGGNWLVSNGLLHQSNVSAKGCTQVFNKEIAGGYTLELEATKNGGNEGFLVLFQMQDENNYFWWNLGGWGNTKHGIERCINGTKTTLTQVDGNIETGRTYSIKITVGDPSSDPHVRCYLDGELIHDINLPAERHVYASANIDEEAGKLYVKVVNPGSTSQPTTLTLKNAEIYGAKNLRLTAEDGLAENTLADPEHVVPAEVSVTWTNNAVTFEAAPYSANIFTLDVRNVQRVEEEPAPLPEAVVAYDFSEGKAADTKNAYPGTLQGEAVIVSMDDGNQALYTGGIGGKGYLDLGTEAGNRMVEAMAGDYTVSLDLLLRDVNNLAQYSWAYALANSPEQYLGLINTGGNTNWYYELKSNTTEKMESGSGLNCNTWHNVTFVQQADQGRLYIDGRLQAYGTMSTRPSSLAGTLTECCVGKSPFASDAILENTYFDNLMVYDQALSEAQVKALYTATAKQSTSSSMINGLQARTDIKQMFYKLNYLHTDTELPASTQEGCTIHWELNTAVPGYVDLDGNTLRVNRLAEIEAVKAAELTARITYADGTQETLTHTVTVAPDDNRYGYLYCFMNSQTEITNYALGTAADKGQRFDVLLGGAEIFDTYAVAGIEHGTRDAYMQRGEDNDGYFITTTDMKQQMSGVWNNYGINLLHSDDMVHWTSTTFDFRRGKSLFSDPDATTGCYDSDAAYAKIYRVWAPQFIWDKDYNNGEGAYLVYYSLLSSNAGDTYDKIYYSYTDRQFKTLTQPRLFFDPGRAVIDADIVFNPYDSLYHMYYKKEGANGYERGIYEATSPALTGQPWTDIAHITNEGANQVEGSSTLRRINEDVYNVYYMRYSGGNAYKYCETDYLGLNFSASGALQGTGAFQHGSVLTVTEEEYTMLQAWSDVKLLLPSMRQLSALAESADIAAAIRQAEQALELTSVSALAQALPAALQALQEARARYEQAEWNKACNGQAANLSFKLANPDFSEGGTGWSGTSFTAASAGVAEQYDKTFDTYQVLTDMPAGIYRLTCQGFYRYGAIATAWRAHNNGTERLQALLYMNEQSQPFLSLYDASAPYTYSPYTYPDGVSDADRAFNTDGAYTGNAVECTLNEAGTLRIGVRKTAATSADWNCFDNFRLQYLGGTDGISAAPAQPNDAPVDVFTVDGVLLRHQVKAQTATDGLPTGIYLVGHEKRVVK